MKYLFVLDDGSLRCESSYDDEDRQSVDDGLLTIVRVSPIGNFECLCLDQKDVDEGDEPEWEEAWEQV